MLLFNHHKRIMGEPLDGYPYSKEEKNAHYRALLSILGGMPITSACTLPRDSNHAFEKMILDKWPHAKIVCFEKDLKMFVKIKTECCSHPRIRHIHDNVITFLEDYPEIKFDLIWLDFCGGTPYNLSKIAHYHLNPGGVFAMTVCVQRGTIWHEIKHSNLFPVVRHKYGGRDISTGKLRATMLLMAFRRDVKPDKLITIDVGGCKKSEIFFEKEHSNKYITMSLYEKYSQYISEAQRQTINMHYIQNVSLEDTAKALGVSYNAISYRLRVAIQKMLKRSTKAKEVIHRSHEDVRASVLVLFKLYGNRLTENLRNIVNLYFVQNLSAYETCKKLRISLGNVYSSTTYAERRMKHYEDLSKKGKFIAERAPEGKETPSLNCVTTLRKSQFANLNI